MLVDVAGRPLPPSGIVERLQEVHPNLGLRWYRRPGGWDGSPWWAITYAWDVNDPRWQWVRNGTYSQDDAVDIVCFLPDDCSADQAYGFLVRGVQHGATQDIRRILGRVHAYNAKANADVTNEVLEDVATNVARELGHFAGKKGATSYGGLPQGTA